MKVKIVQAWNGLPPGFIGDIGTGVAKTLVARGFAVEVKPGATPRNRAMSSPERTADRTRTTKARRVTNGS
jgi:hypothetical protein